MSQFLVMAATLLDIKCKSSCTEKRVNEEGRGGPQSRACAEAAGI